MMKNLFLLLTLWLGFAGSLSAQVRVEVLLSQDQFVPNEPIPVRVRVVNHSGQTLYFGNEDWLSFSVETRDVVVIKSGEPAQPHDFDVKNSEVATTPRTDLEPCFAVGRPGRYTVTASVRIKDWDRTVTSAPVHFDIVRGVRIWEQEFGIPQSATNHDQPEIRKYILQQATLSRQTKLYFRLTDGAETKTFRVIPIGPVISFTDPQTRVDQNSNLHLLYQDGAHLYSYLEFNPDGEMTVRQTYDYGDSAPHLKVDEAGNIRIMGGVRRLADNDIPSRASLTNVIPPPTP